MRIISVQKYEYNLILWYIVYCSGLWDDLNIFSDCRQARPGTILGKGEWLKEDDDE